jgi:hypothetical protein
MSIGDNAEIGLTSYAAFSKETTFGTYASATTAMDFLSCGFRVTRDSRKLDSFGLTRGFTKRVSLNKNVQGPFESYLHPVESTLLIAAALGGPIASTGTTLTHYTHSVSAGDFNTTTAINSLSANVKKGTPTFRYSGGRVNNLKIVANVGEPVMLTAEFLFKDATLQSDDIESTLSLSSVLPFTFVQGSFRYADTEASLTSTAVEAVVGVEIEINNNFKYDNDVRQLGSDIPSVIPATRREVMLKIKQRFDTTTAYSRFIANTMAAAEVVFTSNQTIFTTTSFYQMVFRFPKVVPNSPDPELSGPNEILMQEIEFDVIVDTGTSGGREIGVTIQNNVVSY